MSEAGLIPSLMSVMKTGWIFIAPFAVLIYALFWLNWQVQTAAIAACAVTLAAGFLVGYRGKRMRPRDIYESFYETGTSILDIMMIVAGASFIIGILFVTGLGSAFTLLLVKVGGDSLLLLLVLTGLVCIVLGMGMPTIAVYVLLAAVVAPSLVEVGIPPLAAHMFILYLGMMSFLTPPVAIAAFFAANLAKAPPMATGWTAMRFGWTAYVVPFLFVFAPALLLQNDDVWVTAITIATAALGIWAGVVGNDRVLHPPDDFAGTRRLPGRRHPVNDSQRARRLGCLDRCCRRRHRRSPRVVRNHGQAPVRDRPVNWRRRREPAGTAVRDGVRPASLVQR